MPIKETIRGFKEIIEGRYDDIPEQAFYMVGPIDEVRGKGQEAAGKGCLMKRAEEFKIEVITPEKVLLSQQASSLVLLSAEGGSLGVLPNHAPLIARVNKGVLKVRDTNKKEKVISVSNVGNTEERARMRADIAKQCREHYGLAHALEDITDCDGCRTEDGRLFSGCRNCAVRICACERKFENCASCPEYACEKLASIFRTDPAARTRLNEIRKLRSAG